MCVSQGATVLLLNTHQIQQNSHLSKVRKMHFNDMCYFFDCTPIGHNGGGGLPLKVQLTVAIVRKVTLLLIRAIALKYTLLTLQVS